MAKNCYAALLRLRSSGYQLKLVAVNRNRTNGATCMSRINKPITPIERAISNIEEAERLIYFQVNDKHYVPRQHELDTFLNLKRRIFSLYSKTHDIIKQLYKRVEQSKSGD